MKQEKSEKEYKTFVNEKIHKELMNCAIELAKAKVIDKPTRYALTKYALKNLLNSFKILEQREKITKELGEVLDKTFEKFKVK